MLSSTESPSVHRLFTPLASLSIFWVYLSSEMIWRVEIDGAGENAAEVRRCLEADVYKRQA